MSDKFQSSPQNGLRPTKAKSYRELLVWQKGIELAKQLYKLTTFLPVEEKFGLTSQMRRAGVSVPSNIAEGQGRRTTGEFVQFISYAEGSLAELDTQLHLTVELKFVEPRQAAACFKLIDELRRMLNALRRTLTTPA